MGEAELDLFHKHIIIRSHIITYGNASSAQISNQICNEIETMWNEPGTCIKIHNELFKVQFAISGEHSSEITEMDVLQNTDPKNNYFRIETFANGNISFVDGTGSNTGYFKLENLYKGSTTAAHEYGHSLGLDHPEFLDIRGKGIPGIMYPRGTLVDPPFQYDPNKNAGENGGTLHPIFRKVQPGDIEQLKLEKLFFRKTKAVIGDFTNIYHWNHEDKNSE